MTKLVTKKILSKMTLLINSVAFIVIAALLFFFLYLFPQEMRSDYKRLSTESYDTVFLSMYPIDNYEEESYTYWRAMDAVVTSHEIPNLLTLKGYMHKVAQSGTVTTVYLGVLPEKINSLDLLALLLSYPKIKFEVILPYPSMDYWLSLSQEECTTLLQTYRDFIPPLLNQGMISPYFFGGAEWLIANPANYEEDFLTTPQISETIMLHSDIDHAFVLTANTQPSPTASIDALEALIQDYRTTPRTYADLSDWKIVFLGDSVIGNYTNTTCIPGVTGGLTGATVYNLGYGGGCATLFPNTDYSMPQIVDAVLAEKPDALPQDAQVYYGAIEFLQEEKAQKHADKQYCFVINYGLNDYFSGAPMASDAPYDIYTFTGAYRTTIKTLREAYPGCEILLNTPNFSILFEYGMEHRFDQTYVLENYADTLIALAEELDVGVLDNFHELGITEENWGYFIPDGTHPGEDGRFLIGQRIAVKLGEMLE